jgi:hypothetical protein
MLLRHFQRFNRIAKVPQKHLYIDILIQDCKKSSLIVKTINNCCVAHISVFKYKLDNNVIRQLISAMQR